MVNIRSRIGRLEQTILPVPSGPPHIIHIEYVNSNGEVVETVRVEGGSVQASLNRRSRTAWRFTRPAGRS
jgi:hypothetical protein